MMIIRKQQTRASVTEYVGRQHAPTKGFVGWRFTTCKRRVRPPGLLGTVRFTDSFSLEGKAPRVNHVAGVGIRAREVHRLVLESCHRHITYYTIVY